jgi:hypothetical protein
LSPGASPPPVLTPIRRIPPRPAAFLLAIPPPVGAQDSWLKETAAPRRKELHRPPGLY